MSVEKNLSSYEEVFQNRAEKYMAKVDNNPRLMNQLIVKDKEACMIINGIKSRCTLLEGYVKFPDEEFIEKVDRLNVGFFLIPNERMLITKGEKLYCLGYKSNNSVGCVLLVHAATNRDDLLIISVDEDLPPLVLHEEAGEDEVTANGLLFKIGDYMFNKASLKVTDVEEGKNSGWE